MSTLGASEKSLHLKVFIQIIDYIDSYLLRNKSGADFNNKYE